MVIEAFQQHDDRLAFLAPVQRRRRLARQGIVGDIGLKTAALATAAKGAVQLHLGVAQLHPQALGAAIDAVVHHAAHADAVFDGHDGEIGQAAPGAEPKFGQGDEVGVVVDVDRSPSRAVAAAASGTDAFGQNRGPEDHALGTVDEAGQADADAPTAATGRSGLGADLVQQGLDRVQESLRPASGPAGAGWRGRQSACRRNRRRPRCVRGPTASSRRRRCAPARTPSDTAGRPRPASSFAGHGDFFDQAGFDQFDEIVVTEAGLTPRSLASCTRGISPAARTVRKPAGAAAAGFR